MIGIIIGLVIMLADAFFIWCCCRVAGITSFIKICVIAFLSFGID